MQVKSIAECSKGSCYVFIKMLSDVFFALISANSMDTDQTIGIIHVLSCINIYWVPRKLFEHEVKGRVFKHLPSDSGSVNAMKQTWVIVILVYLTLF